jgi:hypothetical protein
VTRPLQTARRSGRLRAPLLASLTLHGLLAAALLRAPARAPLEEPLAIELLEAPEPPAPTPMTPAPVRPQAGARPEVAPEPTSAPHHPRSPRQPVARAAQPEQPPAPPSAPPAAPASSSPWMQLRSPAQALARGAAPYDPGGLPAAAPSDALALADRPPPNVIHHPFGNAPHTPGVHQAPSGVTAKVAGDGAVTFKDPGAVEDIGLGKVGVGIAGKFDLNDTVARAMGDDPYAYAKKKFAEATFEDRLCLAEKAAMARKQQALFALKDRLEALRAAPGLSTAERRQMVFEMWDECLDEPKDGPDLGAAARATILAFIRRAFPPDGPAAYALNELAAFNRRRTSRVPFDPYGTLGGPPPDAGAR